MRKTLTKGFTLIELLVVIAIIGILASIVLVSLNSARNKGKDASVQSEIASLRGQAEIYYSTNSTYAGACASSGTGGLSALLSAAASSSVTNSGGVVTAAGTAGTYQKTTCHDKADAWAAEAPLSTSASSASVMWCADSTGTSKQTTTNLATSGTYQYQCQ